MISINFRNKLVPFFLAMLRIVIGWHFLYEGLSKVLDPTWSSKLFLEGSRWIFGDLFRWMVSGDTGLWLVDHANAWGLTLIGVFLILGLATRIASWLGVTMLLMYYLAYPPFGGLSYGALAEGNYLIVNKNLVELFALMLLAFSRSGQFFGFDMLRIRRYSNPSTEELNSINTVAITDRNRRRDLVKGLVGLPFLAGFAGAFLHNMSEKEPDASSGATIKVDFKQVRDLNGKLAHGKLGEFSMTRLIMGCNLISGYAHARDLKYANTLFKAYNSNQKILETFHLGEMAGINATFLQNGNYPIFHKYIQLYDGKMQTICQTYLKDDNFLGDIDLAIDNGANTLYIQGAESDRYVREGKIEMLGKAVDYIKKQGYLAGVGAHSIEVIKACEREGIPADYYVKTFHHDKYWSAHPAEQRVEFSVDNQKFLDHNKIHDNMFDLFPETTAAYMKGVRKPWIAFKVLAAGAILPKDGFRFAFENGADFICVGMFDFQIVDNVNTTNEILESLKQRERGWFS
jgi:uncharacterized membrane protein YphA (DoxX/SURF4 family)